MLLHTHVHHEAEINGDVVWGAFAWAVDLVMSET